MTITSSGRNYTIVNVALTDTFVDVQVSRACTAFSIQAMNGTKLKLRRSVVDAGEWTIKEDVIYNVDSSLGTNDGQTLTIAQAKCANVGMTDTLELWCWYGA